MSPRPDLRLIAFCLAALFGLAGCQDGDSPDENAGLDNASTATAAADTSSPSEKLIEEAVSLIQQRQFNSAVQKLGEVIQNDPACAEAYFQRAGILADAGQDRLALSDYAKALELNANDVRYHNMRGLFLLTRRQYEAALADFAAAIQVDPKYIQAYNNRGLVHLARSDYNAAVTDFNKAVETDPTYADGYNNRGFAWYQAGVNDKALTDFNKTLQLNPKYVNAYNNRAMLFMKLKKYREAVQDFSAAIKLDENNVKHYQNRRAAYLELRETDLADADGDRVAWLLRLNQLNAQVQRSPKEPQGYIERAGHLAKAGRDDVALANFERAIDVAPDSVETYVSRAKYWLSQGEFLKAVQDCDTALAKQWSHQTLSIRGDAYFGQGKFDEAIADYSAAKRLDSTVAEAYYRRALKRRERGDAAGAQSDLETARRLDPEIGQ